MNKKEYWEAHKRKNPKFADESARIEMSVGMLKRLMEEAWDKGFEHSKSVNDNLNKMFEGIIGKAAR